jgi:hypothetical protein
MQIIQSASTVQIGDTETYFLMEGTETVKAISYRPAGSQITIRSMTRFGNYVSSDTLEMDDGCDYWWDTGDSINFISFGTGWREMCRNEASYTVDGRFSMKTDTFTTSSTEWIDVPGLTVIYKPRSPRSLIELTANICIGTDWVVAQAQIIKVGYGGIKTGNKEGSRTCCHGGAFTQFKNTDITTMHLVTYDTDVSTDECTYQVQIKCNAPTGSIHINRTSDDVDQEASIRGVSTFKVIEYRGYIGSLGYGNQHYTAF